MRLVKSADEERLELERETAIRGCLLSIYATYDREPPEGIEMNIKVSAWRMALADVPLDELADLVRLELQNRTSEFLPVPADLLRRWKGEEAPDIPNSTSRAPLAPTPNELAMRSRAHRSLPEPDSEYRRAWETMRDKLWPAYGTGEAARLASRETPHDELTLSTALGEYADMAVWTVPRDTWAAFGWWLLERVPVAAWTPELAREQWQIWQMGEAVPGEEPANAMPAESTPEDGEEWP